MAPEFTPSLIVLDLEFRNDLLEGSLSYFEAPPGERLRIRWAVQAKPPGFLAVQNGVAYVRDTGTVIEVPGSSDARPIRQGNNRNCWPEGGQPRGEPGPMIVLILPDGYTLSDPQ